MDNTQVCLIFPHQLFAKHPAIKKSRAIYLIEETLFFNQYAFHKKKLMLHRASMQYYADRLKKDGYEVRYMEATDENSDVRFLLKQLKKDGVEIVFYADVTDNWLAKRIVTTCETEGLAHEKFKTPNFLNDASEHDFFDQKKRYFQADFYAAERKLKGILLEQDQTPLGGKWSYDQENRKRFPAKQPIPSLGTLAENSFVKEAGQWVEKHYPNNYGSSTDPLNDQVNFYPVTHADAKKWLQNFFENRFAQFGDYEDAMVVSEGFLHHSVLSPMLNIGLLDPQQIIDEALLYASEYEIPLNSLEGFIRQVMGWREFIHLVYEREGSVQRTKNFWNFKRKIPKSFWTGNTGIHPVDTVIKRVLKYGYCHHIERLMVLGNFMLLCEFDPDEVYRWFMELFVDSYDWVMVPNTYGMTQYADGGLMTTKPYISGSNYLLKMGNWEKGEWQEVWDGLFWRFMHQHRAVFSKNPRLGMLLSTFDKMDSEKRKKHLDRAAGFLRQLSLD
ncbi:cryptochrome/photolyase family protein [Sphingobacterium sp. lm-10]|uniref:cryptochrome/photolyase family protein n=1 Tax=Sphingobacterium sp. lm-10 TaxID=2944904 RepID=UPI0020212E4B|nr:cryptochrome/photolyase family protein [Sphingobacterium sp. lm-10]MCL7987826.1 cryptochrome/photolyase family protein [Sphingobacterium sp. lm-10]